MRYMNEKIYVPYSQTVGIWSFANLASTGSEPQILISCHWEPIHWLQACDDLALYVPQSNKVWSHSHYVSVVTLV